MKIRTFCAKVLDLPTVGSQRPTVGSRRPTVGSLRPTVGSLRPTVGSPRRATHGPRWAAYGPWWPAHGPRWGAHGPWWAAHGPRWAARLSDDQIEVCLHMQYSWKDHFRQDLVARAQGSVYFTLFSSVLRVTSTTSPRPRCPLSHSPTSGCSRSASQTPQPRRRPS